MKMQIIRENMTRKNTIEDLLNPRMGIIDASKQKYEMFIFQSFSQIKIKQVFQA